MGSPNPAAPKVVNIVGTFRIFAVFARSTAFFNILSLSIDWIEEANRAW